jgi:hypothetical protein
MAWRSSLTLFFFGACFAVLAAACAGGAGDPAPHACQADPDCSAGAWCVRGACVADTPPAVEMNVPSPIRSNLEVELTAAASDPDPGDSVAGVSWSITPLSGCAPDVATSSDPTLRTIFWCAGSYRVELAAVDRAGVERRIARTIEVEPSPGAPSVTAGADFPAGHLCAGAPLSCAVLPKDGRNALALSAGGSDPDGGALTFEWIPVPPAGVEAQVTFDPSSAVPQPTVHIQTAGGAIAGTWRFKARVRDAQGLLAQAVQTMEVENLPPVIVTTAFELPHRYEAPSYLVDAALAPVVEDPEGDPVVLGLEYLESPAGACASSLTTPADGGARLQISCLDPVALIGGVGRSVTITAMDSNGAPAVFDVPIRILNSPPVVTPGTVAIVDHTVEDCAAERCFVASGRSIFTVTDPDGDPLSPISLDVQVAGFKPSTSTETGVDDAGPWYKVRTKTFAPLEFRAANSSTGFTLVGSARDPWDVASWSAPILIRNNAPGWSAPQPARLAAHRYDAAQRAFLATGPVGAFRDPDGDPISLTVQGDPACSREGTVGADGILKATCKAPYDWTSAAASPLPGFLGTRDLSVTVADAWEAYSLATDLTIPNATPDPVSAAIEADQCVCACVKMNAAGDCISSSYRFAAKSKTVTVATDGDNDPLTVSLASTGPSPNAVPTSVRCLGGACTVPVSLNSLGTYTIDATATDGVATGSQGTIRITATCSLIAQPCSFQ